MMAEKAADMVREDRHGETGQLKVA
jgi:choline dehydrogenase